MMLVTGGCTLLIALFIKLFNKIGKSEWNEYLPIAYLIVHCLGAVCIYKEWVPNYFREFPKDVM